MLAPGKPPTGASSSSEEPPPPPEHPVKLLGTICNPVTAVAASRNPAALLPIFFVARAVARFGNRVAFHCSMHAGTALVRHRLGAAECCSITGVLRHVSRSHRRAAHGSRGCGLVVLALHAPKAERVTLLNGSGGPEEDEATSENNRL